jgi:hypothetical protein
MSGVGARLIEGSPGIGSFTAVPVHNQTAKGVVFYTALSFRPILHLFARLPYHFFECGVNHPKIIAVLSF